MHRSLPFALAALLMASTARAAVIAVPDSTAWRAGMSAVSLVDFEAFTGDLGGEYPGLTFEPLGDGLPYSQTIYPYDGANCMFTAAASHGGGGWAVTFDSPVQGVAFWTGDLQWAGSTITFLDPDGFVLGAFDLYETGQGNGPVAYGFNGYIADDALIQRVEVTIDPKDAVWFDNLSFGGPAVTSVPGLHPSTAQPTWGRLKNLVAR